MTGQAGSGLNAVVCYPNEFVDDEEHRFYFTTDNGELFYAGFLNEDLYDADKGGYLKSYSDVHVPETEVTIEEYDYLTEEAKRQVKLLLNYPNTADFGMFDWGVGRSDEHYKIIGKVSAKNGFGGSQDIFFGVWFIKNESGRFSLEGIEFNGVRVK